MPAINPRKFEDDQDCYARPPDQGISNGSSHFTTSILLYQLEDLKGQSHQNFRAPYVGNIGLSKPDIVQHDSYIPSYIAIVR